MESNSKNVVITSALRTAIGTFGGSLKDMQANELGVSIVIRSSKKDRIDSCAFEILAFVSSKKIQVVDRD